MFPQGRCSPWDKDVHCLKGTENEKALLPTKTTKPKFKHFRCPVLWDQRLKSCRGNDGHEGMGRSLLDGAQWEVLPVAWCPESCSILKSSHKRREYSSCAVQVCVLAALVPMFLSQAHCGITSSWRQAEGGVRGVLATGAQLVKQSEFEPRQFALRSCECCFKKNPMLAFLVCFEW